MYICDNWYVSWSTVADSRLRRTTCTLRPPDDGLLAGPKHVEV
jgi:hypothetical protein